MAKKKLPPEVEVYIESREGRLKDAPIKPEDFFGREDELRFLSREIESVTQGTESRVAAPAQVVTAAPGAGKTSLLEALARRLAKNGIAVARLAPKQMLSAKAFSDAIRKQPPWSYFAKGGKIPKKDTDVITVEVDSTVHLTKPCFASFVSGGTAEVPNTEVSQKVIDAWRNDGTPKIDDVLQVLDTWWAKGTVICVDEAQDLGDLTDNNEAAENCASQIIRSTSHPDGRVLADIKRASLCCFGLADTPEVVQQLGSPTVVTTVLPPLHEDYVAMMIDQEINKAAGKNQQLAETMRGLWSEPLTAEFSDWTRHAEAGAEAAFDLLSDFGEKANNPSWSLQGVTALGTKYKERTYRDIRSRAVSKGVEKWMKDVAVQALWRNGNLVSQGLMHDAIDKCLKQRNPSEGLDKIEDKRRRVVLRLMRSGIMDRTDHLPNDAHEIAYYCPIPSLLTHLSADKLENPKATIRALKECGLGTKEPKAKSKRFRPTWTQWTPEKIKLLDSTKKE